MKDSALVAFTRKALVVLLLAAMVTLAWKLSYLLILIFASLVVAVVLQAIAKHFERLRLGAGLSVVMAVLSLLLIFVGLGLTFGGLVAREFTELGGQLPQAVDMAQHQLNAWHVDYDLKEVLALARSQFSEIFQRASGFVVALGGVVGDVAVVFVGGIFFAADPGFYRDGLLRLLPPSVEDQAREAFDDVGRGLHLWLKGQLLSSLFIAVVMLVGLWALGVPSAVALAILSGSLDFIPYLGPVLAAVPGVLVAFSEKPDLALWTAGLFVAVQQLQGNIVQPMIQKSSVDLPPAALLFAVIATGTLFGPPGVVLAAPMTITGFILIQHFYIGGLLGREARRPAKAPTSSAD